MNIAIITGASSGLGAEFARQIDKACLGLDEIWLLARRADKMADVRRQLNTKVRIFGVDITSSASLTPFMNALKTRKPDVRILVNCAGFGKVGLVSEIDLNDSLGMVDLNCKALTKMTEIVLPYMKKRSYIIMLASAASFMPQPSFAVYAATKSYVLSLGRALNAELKAKKIYVTCVCPGPVDTEFFEVAGTSESGFGIKKYFISDREKVVRQALKDTFKKKDTSVYGLPMKMLQITTKILPQKLVVDFYANVVQGIGKDQK